MQIFLSWFTKNRKDRSKFTLFYEATADLSQLERYFSNSAMVVPNFKRKQSMFQTLLTLLFIQTLPKAFFICEIAANASTFAFHEGNLHKHDPF